MKISLNWLEDFVEIQRISATELAQKITEHCFEVEKILGGKEHFAFSKE